MRIAQRFSVGSRRKRGPPSRRDGRNPLLAPFNRPSGTELITMRQPKAEALGYCRMSLRDKMLPRRREFPKGIGLQPAACRDSEVLPAEAGVPRASLMQPR